MMLISQKVIRKMLARKEKMLDDNQENVCYVYW